MKKEKRFWRMLKKSANKKIKGATIPSKLQAEIIEGQLEEFIKNNGGPFRWA